MKIIALAGSNSKNSINLQLAEFAASLFESVDTEVLDLNDFDVPVYSKETEEKEPQPVAALRYHEKIRSAGLLIISLAENNSSFNAAYKNMFDWISRWEKKQFLGKPMLLLGTSPGPGAAKRVHEHAMNIFPHHGADVKGRFLLPSFTENFKEGEGITNVELLNELKETIAGINRVS